MNQLILPKKVLAPSIDRLTTSTNNPCVYFLVFFVPTNSNVSRSSTKTIKTYINDPTVKSQFCFSFFPRPVTMPRGSKAPDSSISCSSTKGEFWSPDGGVSSNPTSCSFTLVGNFYFPLSVHVSPDHSTREPSFQVVLKHI